jgi:hypothetical protein
LVCGYFSDSLNRKIIDVKYYQDIGVIAYSRLNSLDPKAYNVSSFYNKVSKSFNDITMLMHLASKSDATDSQAAFLILRENLKVS